MAPKQRAIGPSNETPDETPQDLSQDLATANAEIERLRALLANQGTPASGTETLSPDRLTGVLEALA